jgi:hypothetical protein
MFQDTLFRWMVNNGLTSQVEAMVMASAAWHSFAFRSAYRVVSLMPNSTNWALRWLPSTHPALDCIFEINPACIHHALSASSCSRLGSRFVIPDDVFSVKVEVGDELRKKSVAYSAAFEMFVDGTEFKKTRQYQHMIHQWQRGRRYFMDHAYPSIEDINSYFLKLERVFEDIELNGYKSQKELGGSYQNEIRVCIAPQGEILKVSAGKHRFAIAQILELPSVPVVVIGVARSFAESALDRFGGPAVPALNRAMAEHFAELQD